MNNKMYKPARMILTLIVTLAMLMPAASAFAAETGTPPTTISPPMYFAASNYGGHSVFCTLSAPEDLRALIDKKELERGYPMKILGQVDFKVDGGSWHYTADWDNPKTFTKYTLNYYNPLNGGKWGQYLGQQQLLFRTMFPDDKNVPVPAAFTSWEWYKSHSMTLKARFAIDFGKGRIVFSDWTPEYVLSADSKMDYKKILADNPPVLKSAKIEQNTNNKRPYVLIQLDRHPADIQKRTRRQAARCRLRYGLEKTATRISRKLASRLLHRRFYIWMSALISETIFKAMMPQHMK